jgi:SNF2 family DNA or RNA helicase
LVPEQDKMVSLVEKVDKRKNKSKIEKIFRNETPLILKWSSGKSIDSEGSNKIEASSRKSSNQEILLEDKFDPYDFNNFVKTIPPTTFASSLKPFQQQGLSWMLLREKYLSTEQLYEDKINFRADDIDGINKLFWSKFKIGEELEFYHNILTGEISKSFSEDDNVRGGILADEMGLGKTIMMIALIHHDFSKRKPMVDITKLGRSVIFSLMHKMNVSFFLIIREPTVKYQANQGVR